MANVILVAGTSHGGWYFEPVIHALTAVGHRVFAPTLSGLDSNHEVRTPINLDTHASDILRVIEENALDEVVLVGHSYGGMPITLAADRANAKIRALVYLDAQVPEPGEREWDLILEEDKEFFLGLCTDGLNMQPPAEWAASEPRVRPHPIATKLQPAFYSRERFDNIDKVFVFAEKGFRQPGVESPFKKTLEKVSARPDWTTYSLPFGHDLIGEGLPEVTEILLRHLA